TYNIGNHFEWTGSTSTMVKYYYAGGQRVAMRQGSSTLYYLLGDHLGSTSVTANSSGGKVAELRYHPWGGTRYTYGSTPTSYQFTGQRNDATGLYFYNARYYDPTLGRFLAADAIVPDPANPQSLNRYSYGRNNPLLYVDPNRHRETRYNEGEIIDEDTINSNVYIEWNPLTKQEQTEVLLDAVGILGVPIVTMAAPAYAGRGAISAMGYVGGTWSTGGEINTTELLLAFYVGGINNSAWWWGGVSNNLQYFTACGIRREVPTVNDVGWNIATGVVATGLQAPAEKIIGKSMGIALGEAAEGVSKGIAPIAADTTAQWTSNSIRNTLPVITKKLESLAVYYLPQPFQMTNTP
ncbi:MAG TPA: RHS repeat-associated core domain-containing protein, partial [Anaerolineae bacterium]|nr:RHS repeat-associated core domain-containing protein [Anaerolineae bacterium]